MKKVLGLRYAGALAIAAAFISFNAYSETAAPIVDKPAMDIIARKAISEYDMPGLKKKMSLDIRAMDVTQFLKFLATEGSLNIVTSKTVTGPVSLLINDVTIGDALEIVLAMNGFAYQIKGNIITIMTTAEFKTMYGVEFYDKRQTASYQLKYASPKNVATILGNMKSDIGKIVYDDTTGILIVIDTPDKIKEMDDIINKQELPTVSRVLPTETKVYELRYAKIEAVKDEIAKVLTTDIGTMRVDTRTNTLVITDLPNIMAKVDVLVDAFDRRTREVFIEAKVVEVTLSDQFQWGIDWSAVMKLAGTMSGIAITPEVSLPLALLPTAMGKMTVSSTAGNNLNIILEALDTVGETRILSNPHITVEEGKESKIEVIEKQPYQEETTTTATGGTTTSSKSYQWVNIGVTLSVTPRINQDGYISMLIKPEISSISTWYGGVAQAAGAVPVVKSANAQTTVMIKDGVTIIIAGLVKDNKTKTEYKIPLLGDIPIIGRGFKKISDTISRTETVVFITPRIVTGDSTFLLEKDLPKPAKGLRE